MERDTNYLVCYAYANRTVNYKTGLDFYQCTVCGRYEITPYGLASLFDLNHLASYLAFHRYPFEDAVEWQK